MKEILKIYFWAFHSIFKIFSLVRKLKKQFLWEINDIVLLFTSDGMRLAQKIWKNLCLVKNEMPNTQSLV